MQSHDPEESLHHLQVRSTLVLRQALHKHAAVLLFENAIVEQTEQSAVVQRSDQPSEALFQGDNRRRHLILKKCVATVGVNRLHPRCHHRIARHRKRQPVDDHTTELLTLHVHTLPERRSGKQHGIGRQPEFIEQRALRCIALLQQGELQFAQQPLVDLIHLRVTREENERTPARNFQQLANPLRRLGRELRRPGIRQISRHIQQRLILIVEVRRQHGLPRMLEPQPLPDVFKPSAHGERGGSQHRALELRPQTLAEDRPYINRRSLQENILPHTGILFFFLCPAPPRAQRRGVPLGGGLSPPPAPPLNPKHRIAVVRLQSKSELSLNLLRPPHKVEYFLWLLCQTLQLPGQPSQSLVQRDELFSVFLEKFPTCLESKPAFSRSQ